jgi:hypothetical protein
MALELNSLKAIMRFPKLLSVVPFLLLLLAQPGFAANTFGTDYSDLWWNPAESGWGANLTHQGDVVFAVIYVYGQDGSARWYSGAANATGSTTFTGPLFEGHGPYLGAPFNSATATSRQVGNVTLDLTPSTSGTLTYSVDGVVVTKAIQRQTFRANNLTGNYIGGAKYILSGCGGSQMGSEMSALYAINHSGSSATISASLASGANCTYSGTYTQAGSMGDIVGTMTCTNGSSGSYHAFEIEAGAQGLMARYAVNYGSGCTETGSIAGLKRFQ